jgi:hypothetical protein
MGFKDGDKVTIRFNSEFLGQCTLDDKRTRGTVTRIGEPDIPNSFTYIVKWDLRGNHSIYRDNDLELWADTPEGKVDMNEEDGDVKDMKDYTKGELVAMPVNEALRPMARMHPAVVNGEITSTQLQGFKKHELIMLIKDDIIPARFADDGEAPEPDWRGQPEKMARKAGIPTPDKPFAPIPAPAPAMGGDALSGVLSGIVQAIIPMVQDGFTEHVRDEIEKAVSGLSVAKPITIKRVDAPDKPMGIQHKLFPRIVELVENRNNMRKRKHPMLVGPSGGGKTTLGINVAKAVDLKFYGVSMSRTMLQYELLGFKSAGSGEYQATPLYYAYKDGGLLFLDEIDSSSDNALTQLHALLENGSHEFPMGRIDMHKDFVCIAAANTYGRGADRQYVGRTQLDAATIDRFIFLDFEYDEVMERAIVGNDAWVDKVQKIRKAAFELKERVVISPRASIDGADLLALGWKEKDILDSVLWKGTDKNISKRILAKAGLQYD